MFDLGSLRVQVHGESTHVYRLENHLTGSTHFSVTFGGGGVLRSLAIARVSTAQDVDAILAGRGLTPVEPSDRAGQVLGPLFPTLEMSFVRKSSRTPTQVGFVAKAGHGFALFPFRLWRGALKAPCLSRDIRSLVEIEPIAA